VINLQSFIILIFLLLFLGRWTTGSDHKWRSWYWYRSWNSWSSGWRHWCKWHDWLPYNM